VHPNDAGYGAIAEAIDLSLFRDHDEDWSFLMAGTAARPVRRTDAVPLLFVCVKLQ
jgi:hypothetical protein